MEKLNSNKELNWNLWSEYCNITNREVKWGNSIGQLLKDKDILPCDKLVDVGCGTGQFTQELSKFTPKVIGIDKVDFRTEKAFEFIPYSFEEYLSSDKSSPNVYIFKQSFHLLQNPDQVLSNNQNSTLVLIQMPQPFWCSYNNWSNRPLNALQNLKYAKKFNRSCEIHNLKQEYNIHYKFLSKMFLEGYTSDLQKMSPLERQNIWNKIKDHYREKPIFQDELNVLIIKPVS